MNSAVCTLFEGNYHYGLCALANSLYLQGYRGVIWAGYRGSLPPWSKPLIHAGGYDEFAVAPGCRIRFVSMNVETHFTNYKMSFMLGLWAKECPEAEALFYFDPDIVVRCPWTYFEEWASSGIALCEDVNSPVPITHPLRAQWRRIYARSGIDLKFSSPIYVNGGFQGIAGAYKDFLEDWQRVQNILAAKIGGLKNLSFNIGGRHHPFMMTDQDALNITLGVTRHPVSFIGKEGMDFVPGGFTMAHAVGSHKPWHGHFLRRALKGFPPTVPDKCFFQSVQGPIAPYSRLGLLLKKIDLRLAAALGRFYRRV